MTGLVSKKDAKGLENATLKEEGAVPEPHEWAMIVVLIIVAIWLRRGSYNGVAIRWADRPKRR